MEASLNSQNSYKNQATLKDRRFHQRINGLRQTRNLTGLTLPPQTSTTNRNPAPKTITVSTMSRTQAVVALSTVLSLSLERRQILLTPSTKEIPLDSLAPYLAPSIFCLLSTIFISSSCTPLPVHFLLDLFHFHIYLVSLPSAIQAQLSRFFSLPLNTR